MKRIVATGAECTGKSTLTQALSGYYGEPWTTEFVREYVDQVGRQIAQEDLEAIAKGQIMAEDAYINKAQNFILHDTNLLSSIIYANHYFSEVLDWLNTAFLAREYTLYLLCTPDGIDWEEASGQRESAAARMELQAKFKESLERLQLPYVELRGNRTARLSQAVEAIDAVI